MSVLARFMYAHITNGHLGDSGEVSSEVRQPLSILRPHTLVPSMLPTLSAALDPPDLTRSSHPCCPPCLLTPRSVDRHRAWQLVEGLTERITAKKLNPLLAEHEARDAPGAES